jgi:coproporphyrinogen III oxidase
MSGGILVIESFESQKDRVSKWFLELRNTIVASFEKLEDTQNTGLRSEIPAGRFVVSKTKRKSELAVDSGGGLMSIMRDGRVFEKVGVNISTVYGPLEERTKKVMQGRENSPKIGQPIEFWASGISVVAHMQNPHCPAVHMNTRMFWTPNSWWFGGGADLNPCIENSEDTSFFHVEMKKCCDRHDLEYYPKFKKWADDYFYIPHRKCSRGVGGIFYDDLNTNWKKDFAFTTDVGSTFLPTFLDITEKRRQLKWTESQKNIQLIHRGLYTEYNLVYDRGTKFGLESGHDANAVLMSLPPVAKWY